MLRQLRIFVGNHLLTGSTDVLQKLISQKEHLSSRSAAVLFDIRNNRTQKESLFQSITTRAIVCADIQEPTKISSLEWRLPLSIFRNPSVANRTLLLAEDRIDSEIYIFAARHYQTRNRVRGIKIAARAEGGGGARTSDKFKRVASDCSDFCLCITDSDKYSPDGAAQGTALNCKKIAQETNWVARHLVLSMRELENLLPKRILGHAIGAHQIENRDYLNQLDTVDVKGLGWHLDLKMGTRLGWALKHKKGSPDYVFWAGCIDKLCGTSKAIDPDCCADRDCRSPDDCACSLAPGLGEKIAEKTLEWLNGVSLHKSLECADSDRDAEWFSIGRQVLEWCCASEPIRC